MKTKFLLLCMLLSFFGFNFAQTVDPDYVDGTVYIKFKANRTPKFTNANTADKTVSISEIPALQKISPKFSLKEQANSMRFFNNSVLASTIRVTINNSDLIDEFIEELSKNPDIEYIEKEPQYYVCSATPPNDPYYGNVAGQNLKWYLDMINSEAAWAIQVGKPNIKVAIVDNAVWGEHPDLQIPSSLQYNTETNSVGNSKPPYSNQDEDCSNPNDCKPYDWSHGTHCAGTVGAINNNGVGIASIGGGVTLMGVSCPGSNPRSVYNPMSGVQWAAENGAKVISMSWGGGSSSNTSREIFTACDEKGIILIAASGNSSSQNQYYPAAYPEIISVASVDYNKKVSSFSNYGTWVEIASPGGYGTSTSGSPAYNNMVFSTTFNKNVIFRLLSGLSIFNGVYYDGMSGTSMACPVAAGLCGLLASYDSTLTTSTVRAILQQSCNPLDASSRKISPGIGYINAEKALMLAKSDLKMVKNPKIERTPHSVEMSWEAPEVEGKTVKAYRIAKNGIILDSNFQGFIYSDSNLTGGHSTYNISAIYQGEGEGLRYTKVVTFGEFFKITLTAEPAEAGTLSGGGTFESGTITRLRATPNPGYVFVDWSRGDISESSDNPYTIQAKQNISYIANFKKEVDNQTIKASQKFNIFPNPAQNIINIESDFQTLDVVYIINSTGAIVKEMKAVNANQTININDLKSGVYVIIAHSGGKTAQAKFTKLPN